MPITLDTPVVVQASEKTANTLWITDMIVQASDPSKPVKTQFIVCPITADGELLKDRRQIITVDNTLLECANNPTLAGALNAIYDSVKELCIAQNLFGLGQ